MLQTKWKEYLEDAKYIPIHNALSAGLNNMQKWYRKADDTSIYFISHGTYLSMFVITDPFLVLDPTRKLTYVEAAWEYERIESNMQRLRKVVSLLSILLI